jgi:hypothetical protein
MSSLFPPFFGSSKKQNSSSSVSKSTGWQRSGPELRREGVRKKDALTSIHNISRGSEIGKEDSAPTSSIARARQEDHRNGGEHVHAGIQTPEEGRQSDEQRYAYIRRLIKEKKEKEVDSDKRKKRGLFF